MAAKAKLLEDSLGGEGRRMVMENKTIRILDVQRGGGGGIGVQYTKPADEKEYTIPWVISAVQDEGTAFKAGVPRLSRVFPEPSSFPLPLPSSPLSCMYLCLSVCLCT